MPARCGRRPITPSPRIPRTASLGYRRKGAEPWLPTVASPSGSTADVADVAFATACPWLEQGASAGPVFRSAGGFDREHRLRRPDAPSRPTTLTTRSGAAKKFHRLHTFHGPGVARPMGGLDPPIFAASSAGPAAGCANYAARVPPEDPRSQGSVGSVASATDREAC
jgi:hypothetical protein